MVTSGDVRQEGDFPPYSSLHDYVYMLLPPTTVTPEARIGSGSSFRAPYLLTTIPQNSHQRWGGSCYLRVQGNCLGNVKGSAKVTRQVHDRARTPRSPDALRDRPEGGVHGERETLTAGVDRPPLPPPGACRMSFVKEKPKSRGCSPTLKETRSKREVDVLAQRRHSGSS